MASIQIRKYQDDDAEAVKEIFTLGMSEHVPSSFVHLLKQPLTQMVLMCVFCALMASSKSFLLPILAVTLLLAGARQLVTYMFTSYIDTSLKKDLNHIRETYLEEKDACFWVAESDGRVVATVACLPARATPGCLELKRMSVRRTHRGMGIAKALCRTVADFTRDRGFAAVILYTSVVQTDAQRLYEHMGYEKGDQMANYRIRPYRDEDYDVVREVYSSGFSEHLNAVCVQALKQMWVQLVLLCFLLATKALSGSFLLSLITLIPLLLAAKEGVRYLFNQGIQLGLREDLLDIKTSYMQEGQVSCFWVAEIQGKVVATVGLLPCCTQAGAWELKRISVKREFRGLGISKTLCCTALEFAAHRGVQDVVLYTSMLQTDAHRLYHSLGFHKIDEFVWPSLPAKLVNFVVFKYGYKVQQQEHSAADE